MSRNYGFYGKRSKSSSYLSSTFQSLSPAKAGKQRLLPEINEIESAISRLNICEETKPKSRTPSISSHGARDDQKDERKLSIEGNSKSRGKKSKRNQKDGRSKEVEDKPIEKKTDIEIRNDSENVTSASSPKREERSPHKALREKSRNIQSPVLKRQGKTEEKIPKASTQSRTNRQSTHHHASPSPPSLPAPARQTRTRRANALDKDSHTASKRIAHAEPLLKLCNDPEGRNAPTNFQAWADEVDRYFDVDKIAEASYGEVYRLKFRDADSVWTRSDESVLKIIALKPPPGTPKRKYKIDLMSAIQDVASEVDLLRRMSTVPGFTNFREVRVMCGRLPSQFVEAWKRFKKAKSKSEFPDPGKAYSYPDDQLWAVIEMQDAGTDLENITLTDVYQLWDVFWGVAMTLAKGEELAGFEHRDLHLGNICVQTAKKSLGSDEASNSESVSDGRKFNFTGLKTTLIDYTLSRAEMEDSEETGNDDNDQRIAYLDLEADDSVFWGEGEYQYDIYRYMRGDLFFDDPNVDPEVFQDDAWETEKSWKDFHPRSNLLWLHFVLGELLKQIPAKSNGQKHGKKEDEHAQSFLANLQIINRKLKPANLPMGDLQSTGDLIAFALEKEWLDAEDVIAHV